jgi:hypothetical protein
MRTGPQLEVPTSAKYGSMVFYLVLEFIKGCEIGLPAHPRRTRSLDTLAVTVKKDQIGRGSTLKDDHSRKESTLNFKPRPSP